MAGLSLYAVAAIIDVGLQVAGWAVSSALKTEKLYDGFGSVTFISIALAALAGLGGSGTAKQVVLCGLVLVWALRLGSFLVVRVFKTGGDKRFDRVKSNPGKFAVYWTLQGLWVYVTLLPFLFAISATGGASTAFGILDSIGLSVFALGFGVESIADLQKFKFKVDGNSGFIRTGLWKFSRHPNYFGEIVLWWGVYLVCAPSLVGPQHLAAFSPLFVTGLLCFVSGIPLLERSADRKWGSDPEYLEYKQRTPVLIPFLHTRSLENKGKRRGR